MKVASIRTSGGADIDGALAVVSEDLKTCQIDASCQSLQSALDTMNFAVDGHEASFDTAQCLSPLPRAYQFLDGSAYVNHVELVRQARGAIMPESFWTDPLMYQGGSDGFLSPTDPIIGDPEWGIDFEGEVAVITGPVRMGADRAEAIAAIRFVMLCNDVSLRNLIPGELAKGFGFVQSKPACAFSPAGGPSPLPARPPGLP